MRSFILLLLFSVASAQLRFQQWFRNSEAEFADISANACSANLTAYEEAYANTTSKAAIDLGLPRDHAPVYALCRAQATCILDNVSEYTKASMATAGIVLGLLPTLLVILSPSINELALLAVQRPVLASLLSLGSPGLLQTRPFEYGDPLEIIDTPEGDLKKRIRSQLALGPWQTGIQLHLISICQYVLVCASIVNTIDLAYQLSVRGVLTWGCTRTWPTLVWAFVPLVIHWIAAQAYRLTLDSDASRRNTSDPPTNPQQPSLSVDSKPNTNTSTLVTVRSDSFSRPSTPRHTGRFRRWFGHELLLCASHPGGESIDRFTVTASSKRFRIGVALNCIAGFLSFFHLVYGTVTFSGLLFIDTLDATGEIAMRFLVSCLVCRFITLVEIAGMRGAMKARAASSPESYD